MPFATREFSQDEADYFKELYHAGVHFTVIAREFGVSPCTARRWSKCRFRLADRPPARSGRKRGKGCDEDRSIYDVLPRNVLVVRPARKRPRDKPGDVWLQVV